MKALKDIIIERLKVTPSSSNIKIDEQKWDISDFKAFYKYFQFADSLSLPFSSYAYIHGHDNTITEYYFGIDLTEEADYNEDGTGFNGLAHSITNKHGLSPVRFNETTFQNVFGDLDFHDYVDAFIYTKANNSCFIIESYIEGLYFYNIFSLDKKLVDDIVEVLPSNFNQTSYTSLKDMGEVQLPFLQ